MRQLRAFLMVLAAGMILIPWQLLCAAPMHHVPGRPSACELRRQYHGQGPAVFPPMHCQRAGVDSYYHPVPDALPLVLLAVLPPWPAGWVTGGGAVAAAAVLHLFPPERRCRSAPVGAAWRLRGPPVG